jgi:L-iditol 2-dehydrogenase
MLAARFYAPYDIRVEQIPVPDLPRNGALLKVLACGLCGTDKRIYSNGHFHIKPGEPRILGHEIAGEIVELDRRDGIFRIGQRVTLAPNVGCGECRICKRGYTQLCDHYDAFGISLDGGFAEYMAVPEVAFEQGNVLSVPEDFDRDETAMIEIAACTHRGLTACRPQKDESVLIIGGGAVTYLMACWARALGAGKVMVSVIDDAWGKLCERASPDVIINSRKEDLKTRVFGETGQLGADVIMIACSVKEVDEAAPDLAAIQGRVNFFGGLPAEKAMVCINSRAIHYREVTITGTTGANVDWMRRTIDALKHRPFDLKAGITHHFPLAEIAKAFDEAETTPRLKTIITCD